MFFEKNNQREQLDHCNILNLDFLNQETNQRLIIDTLFLDSLYQLSSELGDYFLFYQTDCYTPVSPIHAKALLFLTHICNENWLEETKYLEDCVETDFNNRVPADMLESLFDSSNEVYQCALSPIQDFFQTPLFMFPNSGVPLDPQSQPSLYLFNRRGIPERTTAEQVDTLVCDVAEDLPNCLHFNRFSVNGKTIIWVSQKYEITYDRFFSKPSAQWSSERMTLRDKFDALLKRSHINGVQKIQNFDDSSVDFELSNKIFKELCQDTLEESVSVMNAVFPAQRVRDFFTDLVSYSDFWTYMEFTWYARMLLKRYQPFFYADIDDFYSFPHRPYTTDRYAEILWKNICSITSPVTERLKRVTKQKQRIKLNRELLIEKAWKEWFYGSPSFSYNQVFSDLAKTKLDSNLFKISSRKYGNKERKYVVENYKSILFSDTSFLGKVSVLDNNLIKKQIKYISDFLQKTISNIVEKMIEFYYKDFTWNYYYFFEYKSYVSKNRIKKISNLVQKNQLLCQGSVRDKNRIKNISDLVQKIQLLYQDYVYDNKNVVIKEQTKNISDLVQKIPFLDFEKNNLMAKSVSSINVKKSFFNEIPKLSVPKKKPNPSPFLISRTLSGYLYPDMDIRTLRLFRLNNVKKNLLFQKQNKEFLSINIEVPKFYIRNFSPNPKKNLFTRKQSSDRREEKSILDNLCAPNRTSSLCETDVLVDNVFRYHLPIAEELSILSQFTTSTFDQESISYLDKFVRKYTINGSYSEKGSLYKKFFFLFQNLVAKFVNSLDNEVLDVFTEYKRFEERFPIYSYAVLLKFVLFSYMVKGFKTVIRWMLVKKRSYGNTRWARRLGLTSGYKGYRLLENLGTTMADIAGLGHHYRVVSELVASLSKVSLRLRLENSIPKGYLLVGPPGTGKTFLVRCVAGESKTPIFIESGLGVIYRLFVHIDDNSGARQVQDLFRKARETTPSIVFIDEIDKFGIMIQKMMSKDDQAPDFLFDFIQHFQFLGEDSRKDYVDRAFPGNITLLKNLSGSFGHLYKMDRSYKALVYRIQANYLSRLDRLTVLSQVLVEVDGIHHRTGIIVIGATNRFKFIDPALTRPGRLECSLFINLPIKQSRIEIMQLYSQNKLINFFSSTKENKTGETEKSTSQDYVRGNKVFFKPKSQSSVPSNEISYSDISNTNKGEGTDTEFWEYLADITVGFSAADLARAMNQSSIQAINQKTDQTIETIEYGIESIISYSMEKPVIKNTKDPFSLTRFAYYQSGKAVLHTLVPEHPDPTVLKLLPRPRNKRHKTNTDFVPVYTFSRAKLETRLIGFYAGKAGELCALSLNSQTKKQKTTNRIKENKATFRNLLIKQKQPEENQTRSNSNHIWDSSLGSDDLLVASHLAHSLVEKWHFYSNKVSILKRHQTLVNLNNFEMSQTSELADIARLKTVEMKDRIFSLNRSEHNEHEIRLSELERQVSTELKGEDNPIDNAREQKSGQSLPFKNLYQEGGIIPWWQSRLTAEMEHYHISYKTWFRLYLPDPKEGPLNVEWVPPEVYYDSTNHFKNLWKNSYLLPTLKNLTYSKFFEKRLKEKKEPLKITDFPTLKVENSPFDTLPTKKRSDKSTKIKESGVNQGEGVGREKRVDFDLTWNDLYKNDRDHIYHALVLTCFNKAFSLLDENRELLDYLADYLLRFEILRRHEIKQIVSDFGCSYPPNKDLPKTTDRTVTEPPVMGEELEKKNEIILKSYLLFLYNLECSYLNLFFVKEDKPKINFIFEKKWGKNSRRPFSRFFSYDKFSLEFFSEIQKK